MWQFLRRDPVIRAALLLLGAVVAVETLQLHRLAPVVRLGLHLVALVIAFWGTRHRLSELGRGSERKLWNYLSLALAMWLLQLIADPLLQLGGHIEPPAVLLLDCMSLGVYLALLLAADVRPEFEGRLPESDFQRAIETAGTVMFAFGLFLYFAVIPFHIHPERYSSRLPSLTLYLAFDVYLAARFAYLGGSTRQRRWQVLYHLIAAGMAVAALAIPLTLYAPDLTQLPLLNSLFGYLALLVPLIPVTLAARLRHWPALGQRRDEPPAPLMQQEVTSRFTGNLMIYALLLPFIHLGLQAVGRDDPDAQQLASALLLFQIAVLGALAVVQYRTLEERSRALNAERERAEGRLLLLNKAFETMRLGVTVKDLTGTILYVNPAEARMHGYTVETLVGQKSGILGPEELAKPMEPKEAKTMRCWSRDSVNTRRDGSSFPVHLTSDLVEDTRGEPVAIVTTCEDITERWRMEDALRQSERDYRGLFENAHDAIIIFRPENEVVLEVNVSACKLYGIPREEFIGMSMERVSHDVSTGKAHIQEVLWKGDFHEFETRQYRRDHTLMYLEIRAAIIEYQGQLAILSINRDITDRKQAEESLKTANEELKTFMSLVSHDLRAPLVNLKGFTGELADGLRTISAAVERFLPELEPEEREQVTQALKEDLPEAMGFIDSSVSRMNYFISALLKLARAGRRELELEQLDMNILVKEVLSTLVYQIGQSDAKVTVHRLPPVVADRVSMTQIMGNLLTNAVSYLQPGRPGRIEVGGEYADHETTYWVRDNGRGIERDDIPKVFEPFRRCGRQDVTGEGMGLAYVQALVRRQGGRLWCESELAAGSTFWLTVSNHLLEQRELRDTAPVV